MRDCGSLCGPRPQNRTGVGINSVITRSEPEDHQGPLPTVGAPLLASYKDGGHKMSIRTIHLDQSWQGIHNDLLAIVA